jgi:hypothetical protein
MKLNYQQTIISALWLCVLHQATGATARRARLETFILQSLLRRWPERVDESHVVRAHITVVINDAVRAGQLVVVDAYHLRLAPRMQNAEWVEAAVATLREAGMRIVITPRPRSAP